MKFYGSVQFRSSIQPGVGPPGEAQVLALNPQRADQLLKVTGWSRLELGSLNLTVDASVVDGLLKFAPVLVEDAATVRYPDQYQHIPRMRKAYFYYAAAATYGNRSQPVLVRRALNPVPGRVELFASLNLTTNFSLSVGGKVLVEILEF